MDTSDTLKALLTASFAHFVRYFWRCVSLEKLVRGRHIDALCEHLQAVAEGKLTNLLINLPPRHTKSTVCTILFPVWLWLRDPTERILSASYGMKLSEELAYGAKKLVTSGRFAKLFPELALSDDTKSKTHFKLTAGGERLAVSVGAATTGFNATYVIGDDLHSISEKESEAERTAAINYLRTDLLSRPVLTRRVPIIVLGQRVHAADVSGWIIDNFKDDPSWTFLCLPLEYDPDREVLHNGIGWRDWRSERGELLFPQVVTPEQVRRWKVEKRHDYPCLYNQDVVNRAGDLFKAEWFRYYTETDGGYDLGGKVVRRDRCVRLAMTDLAVSTDSDSDYTVCVVADCYRGDIIVRHVLRERLDGTKLIPKLKAVFDAYKPQFMGVERAGQQKVIIDQLRAAGVTVRAISPEGKDKEVRSISAQIRFEAGQVWFPSSAPWKQEVEDELLAFPRGRHDDVVDAVSYLVVQAARFDRTRPDEDEVVLSAEDRMKRAMDQQAKWIEEAKASRQEMISKAMMAGIG